MNETSESPKSRLQAWNQNGRLYLLVGAVAAVVSLTLIALAGLVAVYCGYRLYVDEGRTVSAGIIAGVGGFGFLVWIVYIATL